MNKYDPLWSKINMLLNTLRGCEVVDLVNQKFLVQHGNDAPGKLLNGYIEDIQKLLDEAPEAVMEEKHKSDVQYGGGLKKLAEDLGNLKYDALASFLRHLAIKINDDGLADARRGRKNLAAELQEAANNISQAALQITNAWDICKPHMKKDDK